MVLRCLKDIISSSSHFQECNLPRYQMNTSKNVSQNNISYITWFSDKTFRKAKIKHIFNSFTIEI